ncbi:hypothetical protein GOB86_06530 [Acetobacter lambici]|uniref:Uncharacterized protein n=1 Tax=Acetobacter lambici TaxID=1332824 RepID=A0ABT1EZ91_9PROT|nr:hypothetical protein [Acetobacter lambici]MCP1258257.1 hypothetical protein [Acetobacter lambici]NHO56723.1 hypothetical protein [Acetobacter lambici]
MQSPARIILNASVCMKVPPSTRRDQAGRVRMVSWHAATNRATNPALQP